MEKYKYSGATGLFSRPNPNVVLWALFSYTAMLAATFFVL